jgi:DNA-binding phage protein
VISYLNFLRLWTNTIYGRSFYCCAVAQAARLNPTQLYRTLSPEGDPSLATLTAILDAMGLRLAVEPRQPERPFPAPAA